ncbi:MAG: serine/threonine protein kinase [Myxococcales bacterium]|nr:MAG: serine/threonine protein kinase [Myxococcales bacterium]
MTLPGSKRPGSGKPEVRTASGSLPSIRRFSSGEMAAVSVGQPSSGEFRSANPQGDAFRPLLELGRGGMARVYLAEKTTRGLRRLVVLKVLEPTLATDPEMRSLFRREAEVCARLHHPNVVQVFEVIDEGAAPFMVMEYVEGVSLSQLLARTEHRLPARQHVHVLMQVLSGLHYFHELKDEDGHPLQAVHRDVSPQNVIVMHEGAVKVLDFGIAKVREPSGTDVTRAGIIKGKLSYMPPEQLMGDASIDRRADIFAVGVMLWEAFARRRMWDGVDPQTMMKALVNGSIPSIREVCPWISKNTEEVVMRAVAPKREARFQTALELQVELEGCAAELGGAVQQRELAGFMETEFGEWRRDRQRSVDSAVRNPGPALDTVLEVSQIEVLDLDDDASIQPSQISSLKVEPPPRRKRGVALGLLLAGGAAAALLGVRLVQRSEPDSPSASSGAPTEKTASAAVAAPAASPTTVVGTPSAAIAETADAAAAAAPSASAKSSAKAAARIGGKPVYVAPRAPVSASPAAAPARNCSPPYVLDAEGVKTYKPECL